MQPICSHATDMIRKSPNVREHQTGQFQRPPLAGRKGVVAIRIVQLGSRRAKDEGVRIGTVRRPPRGVPKGEFASRDFYDVWLPDLAPSAALVKVALAAEDERAWRAFTKRYRSEMSHPEVRRLLDLLAALSHSSDFSVGCYCQDERRCHRSALRELLAERNARIA
jgi:uncharacterized protein YeaO (DUF488 family)